MLSNLQANILALNQSIPINGIASVTLTIDINKIEMSADELARLMSSLDVVDKVELVAIE